MQHNVLPDNPRPVYVIGAGGIVNDAHLPAYQIARFPVAGICDVNVEKASATARRFGIPAVYDTLAQMLEEAPPGVIFDMAIPGAAMIEVLERLPEGAFVLMQKPMGENLEQAIRILELTRRKRLVAGVNFQLRYAPFINSARHLFSTGLLGELCDVEINVNVYTPWHLWSFLLELPRVEILYHSIHYIDLVRNLLGNPGGIYAKTVKHPLMQELASVRSSIIMDYGDRVRAVISTNHCHQFGLHRQHAYIRLEGTNGAVHIKMGLLMDYPAGIPDVFEYVILEKNKKPQWKTLKLEGEWFPHAFIGSMSQVMRAAEGAIARPDNTVEDCIHTMACVEAAYASSEGGAMKVMQHF